MKKNRGIGAMIDEAKVNMNKFEEKPRPKSIEPKHLIAHVMSDRNTLAETFLACSASILMACSFFLFGVAVMHWLGR